MTNNIEKAFQELESMGVVLYDHQCEGQHFKISGEESNGDTVFADYYNEFGLDCLDDFGVHKDVNAVLQKHGLYAEWANAGYLNVYDA